LADTQHQVASGIHRQALPGRAHLGCSQTGGPDSKAGTFPGAAVVLGLKGTLGLPPTYRSCFFIGTPNFHCIFASGGLFALLETL
jgi:hypothetical protein